MAAFVVEGERRVLVFGHRQGPWKKRRRSHSRPWPIPTDESFGDLSSVSDGHDAGSFDHDDRRRTRAVDDALGHAAGLMLAERDRVRAFDVDQ
jgi:hypothetical protein